MTTAHPAKSSKPSSRATERIHVDVVGGSSSNSHITFLLQAERQMQAVAFTTGKHPTELFLVGTGEVKTGQIGACINVAPSHANQIVPPEMT